MATTVGFLNVKLGMGTGAFTSGAKKAQGSMTRFGKTITSTKALLVGFAGAAGLGLVIRGLKRLVSEQLKVVDAMAKLADRTGFTTENLAALSLASRIAGTDTEVLNRSLEIFSKRMGEVALGTGEAKVGFEALGLSIDEMLKLSPIEAFKKVADGIANLTTQAEKAAVANLLFGRSGAGLVNLFDAGAEAIDRAASETERFGTAISRVDAAKIEEANDALTRLGELFDGLIRQVSIELAPAIESFTESLRAATEAGGGFGKVFNAALNSITLLWEGLNGGVAFYLSLQLKVMQGLVRILRLGSRANLGPLAVLVPDVRHEIELLDNALGEMAAQNFQRFTESGDRAIGVLNNFSESAEKAKASVAGIAGGIAELVPEVMAGIDHEAAEAVLFLQNAVDDIGILVNKGPIVPFAEEIKKAADVIEKTLGDNPALTRGSRAASDFLRQQQTRRPLKTLEQIAKEQLEVQRRLERNLQLPQVPAIAVFGPGPA